VIDLRPEALIEARARLALANALRILDRYDEALEALERTEAVLTGLDRPELLARIWGLRGNIYFPRGELENCLMAHENALAWAKRAGSPVDEARAFGGVGDALYQRGRMKSARDHFKECVDEARAHGAVGLALSNAPMLALTRAVCGEAPAALEECAAIAAEAERFGDPRSELITRDVEAMISLFCADYERIRRACDRGLALEHDDGAEPGAGELGGRGHHLVEQLAGLGRARVRHPDRQAAGARAV